VKPEAELHARHPVMTCPACELQIAATITVGVKYGEPVLGHDGTAEVSTSAELLRFNLQHACAGPVCTEEATS